MCFSKNSINLSVFIPLFSYNSRHRTALKKKLRRVSADKQLASNYQNQHQAIKIMSAIVQSATAVPVVPAVISDPVVEPAAKAEKAQAARVAKAEKAQAARVAKAEKAQAARVAKAEKAQAARVAKAEKAQAARVAKAEKAQAARVAKAEKAQAKAQAKAEKETYNLEKTKVKRQNCDHNHTEILTALVLYNKEIQIEDILNMVSPPPNVKCSCEDFIEYKEDLSLKWSKGMTHQKRIKQYLENLKDKIKNTYFQDNVEEVFVCGKNNKYDEIDELNKNLNKNNKKDARADIYIKLKNGKFIGLSVKSNEKDALCNISVYKTFSPEHEKQSIEIKNNFLTENGFGVFNENDRPEINKLFKENLNNPVFNDLREENR